MRWRELRAELLRMAGLASAAAFGSFIANKFLGH